jgi:hypothetical protein
VVGVKVGVSFCWVGVEGGCVVLEEEEEEEELKEDRLELELELREEEERGSAEDGEGECDTAELGLEVGSGIETEETEPEGLLGSVPLS